MTRLFAAAAMMITAFAAQAEEVTTYTLENGMEVVVIEDNRAPVVVHMVWYKVGSADEPVGTSGIAHFLEHLMFKGTDVLEPGEFPQRWRPTAVATMRLPATTTRPISNASHQTGWN